MDFLKKLQTSDDAVKRRWLIGSSAVMMIFVIAIWLSYFNTLVQTNPSAPTDETTQGLSFWQTFKGGFGIVSHDIGDKIRNLFETLKSPKSYNVK